MHGSVELDSHSVPVTTASTNATLLHIDESRAQTYLGSCFECSYDDKVNGWYLDTDATHHMTGRREYFSDVGFNIRGFVKFGDASAVKIAGAGSVIFVTKISEHQLLTGVYYVSTLCNSIVSLGQLDENRLWMEI